MLVALLAAARIIVRGPVLGVDDLRDVACDLLADHAAVFRVNPEGTASRITVDAMRPPSNTVPLPVILRGFGSRLPRARIPASALLGHRVSPSARFGLTGIPVPFSAETALNMPLLLASSRERVCPTEYPEIQPM